MRALWDALSWYFQESLGFLFIPETVWISVALVVHMLAALLVTAPFSARRWKPAYWRLLYNFLFFPAMFAIGVAFGNTTGQVRQVHGFLLFAFYISFFGPLALGSFWIYKLRGVRWFALSIVLLQQWLLVGAAFLTGMALTGDWL